MKKDLLIVYNTYGIREDFDIYSRDIDSILYHINLHNLHDNVRFVISAVLKPNSIIEKIKNHYGNKITIFRYDTNLPVQVTANKTILSAITYFQEDYEGYLYTSADVVFNKIENLFPRIISNLYESDYGIMHLYVDKDNEGDFYECPKNDVQLFLGRRCNLNVAVIHKDIKNFYGRPLSDVHGKSSTEMTYGYICSAIRRKYVLLGDSECIHKPSTDSLPPKTNSKGELVESYQPKDNILLWGLTFEDIANDKEGLESGLGYFGGTGPEKPFKVYYDTQWIQHDVNKYDENNLSIDERLKFSVKRNFFVSENRFDYNKIEYDII